jgi:hypothetical protein
MTIKQMVKKAKNVFAWVILYDGDGEYVQVKKSWFLNLSSDVLKKFDKSKFLFHGETGDLYIN